MRTFKGTPGDYKIDPNPATHVLGLQTVEISTTRGLGNLPEWVAYVRGNNIAEAIATAKLFSASKQMMEALQELLRFKNVMIRAADLLQFSDNYVEALTSCEAALSAAID